MSSLTQSIADIWGNDATLKALVPVASVFTGRIPQTKLYDFPYVSVLAVSGSPFKRTDRASYTYTTFAFHIWVDGNDLATAQAIADGIEDCYLERCWDLENGRHVRDVLDEGKASEKQVNLPTRTYWEVVKLITLVIERERTDHGACCQDSSGSTSGSA